MQVYMIRSTTDKTMYWGGEDEFTTMRRGKVYSERHLVDATLELGVPESLKKLYAPAIVEFDLLEINMTKQFEHDCEGCTFLGQYKKWDLYHCMDFGTIPTLIARWGDEGPENTSGEDFSLPFYNPLLKARLHPHPGLAEARRRAQARGLPLLLDEEKVENAPDRTIDLLAAEHAQKQET